MYFVDRKIQFMASEDLHVNICNVYITPLAPSRSRTELQYRFKFNNFSFNFVFDIKKSSRACINYNSKWINFKFFVYFCFDTQSEQQIKDALEVPGLILMVILPIWIYYAICLARIQEMSMGASSYPWFYLSQW